MISADDIVRPTFAERQLVQRLLVTNRQVNDIFRRYIGRVSPLIERYRYDPRGVVIRDRITEALLKKELDRFVTEFDTFTKGQMTGAWQDAEERTGGIIKTWAESMGLADVAAVGAYARNMDAMSKFIDRKTAGMNLSDRVWKMADNVREQVEFYLQSGLSVGRSINTVSTVGTSTPSLNRSTENRICTSPDTSARSAARPSRGQSRARTRAPRLRRAALARRTMRASAGRVARQANAPVEVVRL